MADTKISALPASTTPLTGTELVPLVQSGTTKKVVVSDLTAGRPVSTGLLTVGAASNGDAVQLVGRASDGFAWLAYRNAANTTANAEFGINTTDQIFYSYVSGNEVYTINGLSKDIKFSAGNLIQGTANKGINFTANTPAAGMTSQLLNWYEEGTWTPTVAASSGSVTSYTVNSATYTRIGRVVVLNFDYTITNNGTGSAGTLISNLPFNIGSLACAGSAREILSTGLSGTITPFSATQLYLCRYDNVYLGGNNYRVIGSITYNA